MLMCNICGIVSENFRPESAYWGKICEYVTKSKVIKADGCYFSGTGDSFVKEFAGSRYMAVVEGKIRNCDGIKRSLGLRGEIIQDENVAELLILSYILMGEKCFKFFKGEFCAAIWDNAEKELIIIRDKIGINTLFYYYDGLRFAFSSGIKGLFNFPFVKKELCDDIYCRLFGAVGGNASGETLFKRIFEIPPGCYIKYKCSKREIKNYHMFSVADYTDTLKQTIYGLEYLCKDNINPNLMQEKIMSKDTLRENIETFVEWNDLPTPYVDLKTISNVGCKEEFDDMTSVFNVCERFKLPSVWCGKSDKEFTDEFLSTIPWFPHKDEKDICEKENVYIKQYLVLPQVVSARRKACKNIFFPFLKEEIVEYSLKSLKYSKKISKHFELENQKCNKTNYKNLKALFFDMLSDGNLMAGLIEREELLKFTRLFPRSETMLYLIQVDIWLNKFL